MNEKLAKSLWSKKVPQTLNNLLMIVEPETRIRIYYKKQRIYDGLLCDLPYGKIQGFLNNEVYDFLFNPFPRKGPGLIIRVSAYWRYELKEVFIPS